MDQYCLDAYAYSSSPSGSTPRTPSPNSSLSDGIGSIPHTPATHYKLDIEPVPLKPILISEHMDENQQGITPEGVALWQTNPNAQPPVITSQFSTPSGSLLGELYDHDLHHQDQQLHEVSLASHEWHQQHHPQHHQLQQQDAAALRRATYPYVRQEREDAFSLPPFVPQDDRRPQHVYTEPLPLLDHSVQPGLSLVGSDPRHHSFTAPGHFEFSSPAHVYRDLDSHVKLEDNAMPMMVPPQVMYRSPSLDQMHRQLPPYLQHPPIPVQHTDDAASKETQYLRRRCFNCSQTEPPSWRRSTLNPGKIVCNKCGLYERTHLRPRPLRFDELRTGNKSRRKKAATLPTPAPTTAVKQETAEAPVITRRSSVSSSSSTSDWDDSLSIASSSSASVSAFSSPVPGSYPLPLEASGHSPQLLPRDGGIRLPNVDIASLSMGSPRPSTAPEFNGVHGDYFMPIVSSSVPGTPSIGGSPALAGSPALHPRDMPEVTGWQSVSVDSPGDKSRRQSILRKAVVA